jgi:hypothetical protein
MRGIWIALLVLPLFVAPSKAPAQSRHASAVLQSVNGAGVHGHAELSERTGGGTLITLTATGLRPGVTYVSLYADNPNCTLDVNSPDNVIGQYKGDVSGTASISGMVVDDVDDIKAVSVRLSNGFVLQACGEVKP